MVKKMLQFCYSTEWSDAKDSNDKLRYISQLHTNAMMYALGEKYDMKGVKIMAEVKWDAAVKSDIMGLPSTVVTSLAPTLVSVYNDTPAQGRGLRDRVVAYAQENWKLIPVLLQKQLVTNHPDFAFDMINSKPLVVKQLDRPYKGECRRCNSTDKWKADHVTCSCGWGERC